MVKEISKDKIQEIQLLEQTLQNILAQKQAFQMELAENEAALSEIDKSGDEIFKIVGQLMIKSDKNKVKEELSNKEKILNLRMKTLEKQEDSINKKLEEYREEIIKNK